MKIVSVILLSIMLQCYIMPAYSEELKTERDYSVTAPVIPVDPAILSASDIPWEDLGNGARRKVVFNDRLTFVILEINRPAEKDGEIALHSHPHDQISYVLEGKVRVKIGTEEKVIETGGMYIVPSNVPHGIQVLSDKLILLDMFTPVREDFRKQK
jgi:quercetin dioxygenase-like cupin family protein